MDKSFLFSLAFHYSFFSTICKASSDSRFPFLRFFFSGMESAVYMCISPLLDFIPIWATTEHWVGFLVLSSMVSSVTCFTYCCCLVAKSYPTLWNSMAYIPLGCSVHGISQARILEWVAISFSRGSSQPRAQTHVSCSSRQIPYCWATREAHFSHSRAAVHGVTQSQTQLSDFTSTFHFHALEKEMATHSSVLAWRIPGTGEPSGLPSVGLHRVRHNWSDLAAAAAAGYICQCQSPTWYPLVQARAQVLPSFTSL